MKCVNIKIRKIAALCAVALVSGQVTAQSVNLVPNGSFEANNGKIKALGQVKAENVTGWTSPTGAYADAFINSKIKEKKDSLYSSTRTNAYGKEKAKEGANYVGIVAYAYSETKLARSYVMVKLDAPLKKGVRYCVTFNVSLAEASKYACNQLGANFSNKPFGTEAKSSIIDVAHVQQRDNKIINMTYGWEKICGVYEAKGGEKYLTIGNFIKNENVKTENNKKPKEMEVEVVAGAYYYLDDVSVVMMDASAECSCAGDEPKNEYSSTVFQKSVIVNSKMTPAQVVNAQQTFFAFGKSNFSPEGKAMLDLIAQKMTENPTMKLEISGHSDAMEDSVGVEKTQYSDMAEKRVDAVIAYLKGKGIDVSRMISVVENSAIPNDEISESDDEDLKMAKNRRVTFRAL
ncbi:MAG: OmpA family protein [Flavobacteriia bacterium]|jgi:outer membrane protein OmpA-like peptidoglycan-associated protein